METKDFKQVVAEYIEYDSVSRAYNKNKARVLTDYLECMKRVPFFWASGMAMPHPRIQEMVIRYINKQKVGV